MTAAGHAAGFARLAVLCGPMRPAGPAQPRLAGHAGCEARPRALRFRRRGVRLRFEEKRRAVAAEGREAARPAVSAPSLGRRREGAGAEPAVAEKAS